MCGIAGFLVPGGGEHQTLAETGRLMAVQLRHRGPDDSGVWVDEGKGLVMAHRRLAILDLSVGGHQPMVSADARYVTVFNGEIYNFHEIRQQLIEKGHCFRGNSDTEVLLASACEWGVESAVRRFVGMFAFALYDQREEKLYLARDRMGEKPLFYGWAGGVFLFSSELKAMTCHPRWTGEIDPASVALYLQYNYVPGPRSIYAGIKKLTPGSYLCIPTGKVSPGTLPMPMRYWDLAAYVGDTIDQQSLGDDEATDLLDKLLRQVVKSQMVADVPVGAFLSGGIDSSTVAALMQAVSSRPVKTFTIGFSEDSFDEARHAKAVASHLGTDHTELYVSPSDALGVVPRLAEIYDEPLADPAQVPTILLSQLARRSVTVSLTGDGGDELFCGYTHYFRCQRLWRWFRLVPQRLRVGLATGLPRGCYPAAARVLRFLNGNADWNGRILAVRHLARMLSREALYAEFIAPQYTAENLLGIEARPPVGFTDAQRLKDCPDFLQGMMFIDCVSLLPDDFLAKVDRASMAASLETRLPLLDHRVVELAMRMPTRFKVRRGKGKWLLRQVLYRHVPRDLVDRPKQGFSVPVARWLRTDLREWAEDLLSERQLADFGCLDVENVRGRWRDHLAGTRNYQISLWRVLMLQSWLAANARRALQGN